MQHTERCHSTVRVTTNLTIYCIEPFATTNQTMDVCSYILVYIINPNTAHPHLIFLRALQIITRSHCHRRSSPRHRRSSPRHLLCNLQPFAHEEPGVRVQPSKLITGELGVVVTRPFKEGDIICKYSGDCGCTFRRTRRGNKYVLEFEFGKEKYYLDAIKKKNYCGRYINDFRKTGSLQNCEICSRDTMPVYDTCIRKHWVRVKALENIDIGDELLADYGPEYWDPNQAHDDLSYKYKFSDADFDED